MVKLETRIQLAIKDGKGIGTESKTTLARNLVLDGQQRLTSLFTSLLGKPVKNSQYKEVVHQVSFRPSDGITEAFSQKLSNSFLP